MRKLNPLEIYCLGLDQVPPINAFVLPAYAQNHQPQPTLLTKCFQRRLCPESLCLWVSPAPTVFLARSSLSSCHRSVVLGAKPALLFPPRASNSQIWFLPGDLTGLLCAVTPWGSVGDPQPSRPPAFRCLVDHTAECHI